MKRYREGQKVIYNADKGERVTFWSYAEEDQDGAYIHHPKRGALYVSLSSLTTEKGN
jgi:hypothetical protein